MHHGFPNNRVLTTSGILEGSVEPGSGVLSFKGVPFAAAPVGALRWKPPQPPAPWEGVRKADHFGARPMQLPLFGDMQFRSKGMSEDCLFLNVWTPAASDQARLPVLVYFYGGGNLAGDSSEPRYDGESLARKGIVVLTVNYRLNVFGFFAHPELTDESPHGASGNYGYLDQVAALRWVQQNIAAFGGDPAKITLAGESAGSISVSLQMVSPLAKPMIAGAIGSSGSVLGTMPAVSLRDAEQRGQAFATRIGAPSLAALRAMSAEALLHATSGLASNECSAVVDGYFLPALPIDLFTAGEQAKVPLLVGWNSEEISYQAMLGALEPTPENFAMCLRSRYGELADEAQRLYPAATAEEAAAAATDLASDLFIGYSTWKWSELHRQTGQAPVYRYLYAHPRPPMRPEMGSAVAGLAGGVITGPEAEARRAPTPRGAVHSADIEYAMGNLATNMVYIWTSDDYALSALIQSYYANFVKTGDPNSASLPHWPPTSSPENIQVMWLDVDAHVAPEAHRERYLFLDQRYLSEAGLHL